MVVGALRVQMRVAGARSLKDKRRVLKSVKDRISNMNIAVAEVGNQDFWQTTTLGFAAVSNDPGHANSILDHVIKHLAKYPDLEITDSHLEIMHL